MFIEKLKHLSGNEDFISIALAIINNAKDAIIICSDNFQILYLNYKAIELFALNELNSPIEKKITEILQNEQNLRDAFAKMNEKKLTKYKTKINLFFNGQNLINNFNVTILKLNVNFGNELYALYFHDITELENIERDNEYRSKVIDLILEKIFVLNKGFKVINIYGADQNFLPDVKIGDSFISNSPKQLQNFLKNALEILSNEYEIYAKDIELTIPSGEVLYYEIIARKTDIGSENENIIIYCKNITYRKIIETKLANSLDYYKALFENATDIIFSIDYNYKIIAYNDVFAKVFSKAFGAQIKYLTKLNEIIPKNKFFIWESWINKALADERIEVEYEFDEKYYKAIYLFSFYPIRQNNSIIGAMTIGRDITENKSTEEKLFDYINQVDETRLLLEEKTKELEKLNQKLTISEKELRELNANKDKFLSIISHDLRSPFHSLLSSAELLSNESQNLSPEEIKLFAKNIYDISKRIFEFLENLLVWSRSQLGKIEPKPEKILLKNLIEKVVFLMAANVQKKEILLLQNIKDDLIIFADANMIFSVFQNLLSNAIKFTPNNGRIIIEAKKTNEHIIVKIEDSGVGIPEEKLKNLFNISGVQSTPGTNQEKGSGLGLVLCKELVEKNKGEIWAESEINKGSKFFVKLPASS